MDLSKKRIMLTGCAGFLGSFVTEKLKAMPVPHKRYAHQAAKARGCKHIFIPKEQDYDLTKSDRIAAAFQDAGRIFSSSPDSRLPTPDPRLPTPEGGIFANPENPGSVAFAVSLPSRALDEGISICKNIVEVGNDLFDPGLTTARS